MEPHKAEKEQAPSDETRRLVDDEVRRIVEDCYSTAVGLLSDNRDKLDALSHTLLGQETLGEQEAYAAAGMEPLPLTAAEAVAS